MVNDNLKDIKGFSSSNITKKKGYTEKGYTELVAISKSTKDLIDNELTDEILKHHPELRNMNLTYNYKIRRAIETYLKI